MFGKHSDAGHVSGINIASFSVLPSHAEFRCGPLGWSESPSADRLFEIAEAKHGLFTTKQAGYSEKAQHYHARAGNWIRDYRGIYRLARYPRSEWADLMLWQLWSRNREDVPQGVYSHETALSLYELSDVMPARLHMTVPHGFD